MGQGGGLGAQRGLKRRQGSKERQIHVSYMHLRTHMNMWGLR